MAFPDDVRQTVEAIFLQNPRITTAQLLREVEQLHGVKFKKSQFYMDVESLRPTVPAQQEILEFYTNATQQLNRLEKIEVRLKELLDSSPPKLISQPRGGPVEWVRAIHPLDSGRHRADARDVAVDLHRAHGKPTGGKPAARGGDAGAESAVGGVTILHAGPVLASGSSPPLSDAGLEPITAQAQSADRGRGPRACGVCQRGGRQRLRQGVQ